MQTRKASNEQLIAAYAVTPSVWRVAEQFGMCGQSVHERLTKLGVINLKRYFTDEERDLLRQRYEKHADAADLASLATKMGRTKQFLCRQAGFLGMTDLKRLGVWAKLHAGQPRS